MGSPIKTSITSIDDLKKVIKPVVPVIELPDLAFKTPEKLQAVDLIAANVGSAAFIIGDAKPFDDFDANSVLVNFYRDKKLVNTGQAKDALGDQYQALIWLINTMVSTGWVIDSNSLLITGALGNQLPSEQGDYSADFSDLGVINFSVQ